MGTIKDDSQIDQDQDHPSIIRSNHSKNSIQNKTPSYVHHEYYDLQKNEPIVNTPIEDKSKFTMKRLEQKSTNRSSHVFSSNHNVENVPDSQANYHEILSQSENKSYFYGSLPHRPKQFQGNDFSSVDQSEISTTFDEKTYDIHSKSKSIKLEQNYSQQNDSFEHHVKETQLPNMKSLKVCRFFLKGICNKGFLCNFSHEQNSMNHSDQINDIFSKESENKNIECGICLEVIINSRDGRFGLLTGCNHTFCLKCIREWRSMDTHYELTKHCPVCREKSNFVIPSFDIINNIDSKNEMIDKYKHNLKNIPCKYFKQGERKCPFGDSCFYLHQTSDENNLLDNNLRLCKNSEGKVVFYNSSSNLATYVKKKLTKNK